MKNFIWGLASASYQTEEPIIDRNHPHYFEVDWDVFHQLGRTKVPRGMATYSWSEIERDITALKSLNLTHYRFGIEWARIEPQPGKFNDEALAGYVHLAKRLQEEGITPVVCLWHFNFPSWLTNIKDHTQHGWRHPDINTYWKPYVTRVLNAFGNTVIHWMPQNEPNTYAIMGYILGMFPPGQRLNLKGFKDFIETSAVFYNQAADLIHAHSKKNLVISVQNVIYWKKNILDVTGFFWDFAEYYNFRHPDMVAAKSDIIGFNYYFRMSAFIIPGSRTNDPQGMKVSIENFHRRYPNKPLWITENGMQEAGDERRPQYITSHVEKMIEAKNAGAPVEAYFAWSLADNWEWSQGYSEKFGLFTMDPKTKQLNPKGSAKVFAELVKRYRGI